MLGIVWRAKSSGIRPYFEIEKVVAGMTFDGNGRILLINKNMLSAVISGTHSQRAIVHPNSESGQSHPLNERLLPFMGREGLDG